MQQNERALVLGGGGSLGNAWEIGIIAGLFEAGLNVVHADLIIGTSAGSTVAAQITSTTQPAQLLAAILAEVPSADHAQSGRVRAPVTNHLERTGRIINAAKDAADMRRKIGAGALELDADSDGSRGAQWKATVAARLPSQLWPAQRLLIPAVDAHTGEAVVFDQSSGIGLADAIAASTSSGAPYGIGENRYIDGGYRRNENADLAAGYKRVLVLSPFGGRTRHPLEWGMQLAAQVDELRTGGSRVETIFPSQDSLAAFGDNMMNLAARPTAARAGYEQGKALAKRLFEFWD